MNTSSSNPLAEQQYFTRINLGGVHFNSYEGSLEQAEAAKQLCKEAGVQASVLAVATIPETLQVETVSHLAPFDLQAALAGASVVTRHNEQITDLHHFKTLADQEQSLVGVCEGKVLYFNPRGTYCEDGAHSEYDLFMLVQKVKKQGWIYIYPDGTTSQVVRATKEKAYEGCTDKDKATQVRVE